MKKISKSVEKDQATCIESIEFWKDHNFKNKNIWLRPEILSPLLKVKYTYTIS